VKTLEAINARAAEMKLAYLLGGGHAVVAHGHPRNTFDLDLIIRRNDRNSWTSLALALGYYLYHEGPTFLQFNSLNSEMLPLDLMFVDESTFNKLETEAVPAPGYGNGVMVVSLHHLLALKCHAVKHGHPGRVEKDVDDVIHLVQANRIDVKQPEIQVLFLKYGPKELYEKLVRLSRR
jgi:hypothetical protein